MKDINIKIAVAGNVDSGKSTFTGVLVNNCLDDGRGSSRLSILRTPHEKECGRTSNISNNNFITIKNNERKIISLIDLAGHEKYFKTTLFGITGCFVDYSLLMIGANMGISKMTKEHLAVLLYLNVPIIIVITKTDICPENIYQRLIQRLKKLIIPKIFKKKPYFFKRNNANKEMGNFMSMNNPLDTFIPIIPISNKSGDNIDITKNLLQSLYPKFKFKNPIKGTIMYVDSKFIVKGIGLVISGTVRGEKFIVGQKVWLGPFNGQFLSCKIRSMHNNVRENVQEITPESHGCIALKFLDKSITSRKKIKKGVILISDISMAQNLRREFNAEIKVLNHATTISNRYSPIIHCGCIRQSASIQILEIIKGKKDSEKLRTGNKAVVKFRFLFRSEYIEKDFTLFFRDGSTKGFGKVIN